MKIFLLILALFPNPINVDSDYKSKKPNILFFLVDDLGWYDVGYHGSKFYETPYIDSLSSKGMKFKNAYSAHPRCVPLEVWDNDRKISCKNKKPWTWLSA